MGPCCNELPAEYGETWGPCCIQGHVLSRHRCSLFFKISLCGRHHISNITVNCCVAKCKNMKLNYDCQQVSLVFFCLVPHEILVLKLSTFILIHHKLTGWSYTTIGQQPNVNEMKTTLQLFISRAVCPSLTYWSPSSSVRCTSWL